MQTDSDKFWAFSKALFDKQKEFFDVNVVHEQRNDTYQRLAKIAGSVGLDEKKIYSLLELSDKPDKDGSLNIGNKVTNDVKLMVKVWNPTPPCLFVPRLTIFAGKPLDGCPCHTNSAVQCTFPILIA